jgi:hypothetical protein
MAFGIPDDDEDQPQYDSLTTLLAGQQQPAQADSAVAQAPTQAQQQQPSIPTYIAAPDTAATQPQQAQAPQIAPSAPTSQPAVVLPSAPEAPPDQTAKYQQLEAQLSKDQQGQQVKPKWWERLGAAAVGFGVGYKEGPSAGIRAGSQVVNRGQAAADAMRDQAVSNDKSNIDQFNAEQGIKGKTFEDSIRSYDAKMEAAREQQGQQNTDRTFLNADREFSRETANDTRAQGNTDSERAEQSARDAETARHNKAGEANERARTAAETAKTEQPKPPTVTPEQWQGLIKERDKSYSDARDSMQDELSSATSPQEVDAIKAKYADLEKQYQQTWNARLSTADPTGRYAQQAGQQGGAPEQQQPPQQVQQSTQPSPPKGHGKPLTDKAIARQYLSLNGGDPAKARAAAARDGWKFSSK